jgi:hypothetical protein
MVAKKLIWLVVLILLAETTLYAASFRLRAREHFDTVWVFYKDQNLTKKHGGIGPNINFWFEEPYNYAIGLSYSHIFIDNIKFAELPDIGEKMELIKWGIEYKHYWFENEGGLFTRLGGSANTLKTKGELEDLQGNGAYLGFGWEIKFSKIGLAFEAASRKVYLERDIEITTFSPSIGVHFYGYI